MSAVKKQKFSHDFSGTRVVELHEYGWLAIIKFLDLQSLMELAATCRFLHELIYRYVQVNLKELCFKQENLYVCRRFFNTMVKPKQHFEALTFPQCSTTHTIYILEDFVRRGFSVSEVNFQIRYKAINNVLTIIHRSIMFTNLQILVKSATASQITRLRYPTFGSDYKNLSDMFQYLHNLQVLEIDMDNAYLELTNFYLSTTLHLSRLHTLIINSNESYLHRSVLFMNLNGLAAILSWASPNLKVLHLGFFINEFVIGDIYKNSLLLEELTTGIGFTKLPPFPHLRKLTEHPTSHRRTKTVDCYKVKTLTHVVVAESTNIIRLATTSNLTKLSPTPSKTTSMTLDAWYANS